MNNVLKHTSGRTKSLWQTCGQKSFYSNTEEIIHLSLCSFIKSPIEAVVEAIGSVINYHESEERSSMSPSTLEDEIMVKWNGPEEFSKQTTAIVKEALRKNFKGSIHFSVNDSRLKTMSTEMSRILCKSSRVEF